jgi:hypothetical protein
MSTLYVYRGDEDAPLLVGTAYVNERRVECKGGVIKG